MLKCQLQKNPEFLNQTAEGPSRKLVGGVYESAREYGFGRDYEGFGVPIGRQLG